MRLSKLVCLALLIIWNSEGFSQKFSAGIFSGLNISDIHGNSYNGKWIFKPGPVQGIFFDYNPVRYIGFSTGINYSTNYYEHKEYVEPVYPNIEFTTSSSIYLPDSWPSFFPSYYQDEVMDFSLVTIPVQLKLTIPSKPALTLSPGVFWSIRTDYNVARPFMYEPAKGDFGFIYSAGLTYPITGDLDLLLRVRYLIGRKDFYESVSYRHGSFDFNLGVTFNGILPQKEKFIASGLENDTSYSRINLLYFAGANFSWNSQKDKGGSYSACPGFAGGFRIDIPIGKKTVFRTGVSFEQTGYALNDSSDVFYGYNIKDDAEYFVNTRTTIDYFEIPVSLKFNIGRKERFFLNTGPYLAVRLNARTTGDAVYEETGSSTYELIRKVIYDDIEKLTKDNDIGWIFGTGWTIPLSGKYGAEVGLRYKTGLRDVFDASVFSGSNLYDNRKIVIRNRSLSIYLGFKIPVSG